MLALFNLKINYIDNTFIYIIAKIIIKLKV